MAKKTKKNPSLKTLAERIKYARNESKLIQAECAKKARMSPTLLNKLESGVIKDTTRIFDLAQALGVDVYWLKSGREESKDEVIFLSGRHEERIQIDSKYSIIQLWAPIITWDQAGHTVLSAKDVRGDYKRAQRYQRASIDSFVLVMDGDSMISQHPGQSSFLPGDILHFDPVCDNRKPKPGDYVIARVKNARNAIFRQLISDCGEQWLVAKNPQYPNIKLTDDVKIFGILIFQGRDLRS